MEPPSIPGWFIATFGYVGTVLSVKLMGRAAHHNRQHVANLRLWRCPGAAHAELGRTRAPDGALLSAIPETPWT